MSHFWDIYENLTEDVYVSIPSTREMVYMNKHMRDTFRCTETSYIGKTCHELLHSERNVCSFCNSDKLAPGEFDQWEFYNPLVERYYRIMNTLCVEDGVTYRLEISIDITDSMKTARNLEQTRKLEGVVNTCMRAGLEQLDVEDAIDATLASLGSILRSERAYIFEMRDNGSHDNTYEWCAEGIEPQIDFLQDVDPEIGGQWYESFEHSGVVMIEDLEDVRESDPDIYELLRPQGVESLLVVPLRSENRFIGFYGIDNPPLSLLSVTQDVLEIMSNFIVTLIRKRNLHRELRKQGHSDFLTGCGNRYALYSYTEQIENRKQVGMLYCDLTGLKATNDSKGHVAGDQLLKDACSCMRGVFNLEQVFRTGGDEFVIITYGMSEEGLLEKMGLLKESFQKAGVNVAVGHNWVEDSPESLDALTLVAEQRMYDAKSRWYRQSGIDRRRQS